MNKCGGECRVMDRRIKKTRKSLFEQLTLLLQEKPLKDITVGMLAEKADINRGTFYLHFSDIYDLKEQMKTEVYKELDELLQKTEVTDLNGGSLPVLKEIIYFAYGNQNLCKAFFGAFGDSDFIIAVKMLIRNRLLPVWQEKNKETGAKEEDYDYFFAFTSSGIIGIVQECVRRDFKRNPEEILSKSEAIMLNGLNGWFTGSPKIKKSF